MFEFFTNDSVVPFTVAIGLMFAITVLQAFGLSVDHSVGEFAGVDTDADVVDIHVDAGVLTNFLGWMYFGKVPFLIILMAFLMSYGLIGWTAQWVIAGMFGGMLSAWVAGLLAIPVAVIPAKIICAITARIFPKEITSAVTTRDFVGEEAWITIGTARPGFPAEAKCTDQYGQVHYLRVEPNDGEIEQGSRILLIKCLGENHFRAQKY